MVCKKMKWMLDSARERRKILKSLSYRRSYGDGYDIGFNLGWAQAMEWAYSMCTPSDSGGGANGAEHTEPAIQYVVEAWDSYRKGRISIETVDHYIGELRAGR